MSSEQKQANDETSKKLKEAIDAHQKAMDDVVSVNGIFSFAMFVGLTFSPELSLVSKQKCKLKDINATAKRLLVFEVVSFSCFLLSSLIAKSLKNRLSTYSLTNVVKDLKDTEFNSPGNRLVRGFLIFLSVSATTAACIFLTMSMVDVIRIRLGKITCESDAFKAAVSVIGIVSLALAIYFPTSIIQVYFSMQNLQKQLQKQTGDHTPHET